ncbi:MAG: bifunctional [glutamate--ammonia ligase]-adenylyl-L-tyrosine phosphorylase/[glutamate--ammonia-ligase] adenylyltransferase, partial [Gammaproteobacteria bacterium]|nr:bifunctional [glutamate--ammonia ligase]-adenylyl-L-tyrosine phosphorylase/[glutamate--ammonia-ligase] adenylyltransferase [Gammaproteobacteria bacterium]
MPIKTARIKPALSAVTPYSLAQVKAWSPFIERLLGRFPELEEASNWQDEYAEGRLYESVYKEVISSSDEIELKANLRNARNWQMGRIGIRDLSGLASVHEVMQVMSDLADALVTAALDWHYARFCQRYGVPIGKDSGLQQYLLVIGMGKLGGQELNFSSDIDLIFTYPEGGETLISDSTKAIRPLSNDQFFVRLGQALNKSLVEMTGEGFVYRVDMRLRPFGDAGSLAITFAGLEHYYELHGRAWERYALVKGRVMAGPEEDALKLFTILRPFVYRRYVDFTAIDALRELKQMIAAQVKKKGVRDNIKLGQGGIREVEFIAQSFQLVHGGRHPSLQSRSLLTTLSALRALNFMPESDQLALRDAYLFLRRAENRLQEWNDQQTHVLPEAPHQQLMLANSMGFAEYEAFLAALNSHRKCVQSQFNKVFSEAESGLEQDVMSDFWVSDFEAREVLISAGITTDKADKFVASLTKFKQSRVIQTLGKEGVARLNSTMPLIMKEVLKPEYDEVSLERVLSVIEAIVKRSVYLVLLKENPKALTHLVELCNVSAWLTDTLVKYPALLDQLLDERSLFEPLQAAALEQEVFDLLLAEGEQGLDEELFMNGLRSWRHAQVFKVAAADVTGQVPVTQVSDYLTWIAEAVLKAAAEFAWRLTVQKSGLPGGMTQENQRNPFMVLGYGKLGGIELGYGSDLDVVFVYEGLSPSDQSINARGRATDNSIYFIRMGQKLISLLTTLMPTGVLYEVDTRLRPNGASGMMVVDFDGYQHYLQNKAWIWEHQAFVRVRAVTGDEQSVARFDAFKSAFLQQKREAEAVRLAVVEMR